MDAQDIELKRHSYGPEPVNSSKDYNEINLDDNQQSLLKQLIHTATIEQLRCISDCCQCKIDEMRKTMESEVGYDDFMKKKKSETQELPTASEGSESY